MNATVVNIIKKEMKKEGKKEWKKERKKEWNYNNLKERNNKWK